MLQMRDDNDGGKAEGKGGEYVVGVDPASRNIAFCVIRPSDNAVVTMAHIDLAGKKRVIPSAKKCAELMKTTIRECKYLSRGIRTVFIEKQGHRNNRNVAVQEAVEEVYASMGVDVLVIPPRDVYTEFVPFARKMPEVSHMVTWRETNPGRSKATKDKRYRIKKKIFNKGGKRLFKRGAECRMLGGIKKRRKELQTAFKAHDKRYPLKKERKTERKVKTSQVDMSDAMITCLVGLNKRERERGGTRDYIAERLPRSK